LVAGMPVQSGYGEIQLAPMEQWAERENAY